MKSYKDLVIYKNAFELAIKCNRVTMKLPKHEMFEIGNQLRRSSQSVRSNIVEGYGRKDYKKDFIRFLVFSHASNLETLDHLEMLKELYHIDEIEELIAEVNDLGKQLYSFMEYVRKNWKTNE
jgi:four helix bundle protein